MKKAITLCLLFLWMAVIVSFSAQNGTQSSGVSRLVGHGILDKGSKLFHQEKSGELLVQQVEDMQLVIRKTGHMGEYALLAVFVLLHICCYKKKPQRFWFWGWTFCVIFAATDEFHQLFVPGREGRILDVCIDSAGSLIGAAVFLLCYKSFQHRKEEKNAKNCD